MLFVSMFAFTIVSHVFIVKPYIPYDVVRSNYTLPMAVNEDDTVLPHKPLKVPNWIVDADIPLLPVKYGPQVLLALREIVERKVLRHYHCFEEVLNFVTQVCLVVAINVMVMA